MKYCIAALGLMALGAGLQPTMAKERHWYDSKDYKIIHSPLINTALLLDKHLPFQKAADATWESWAVMAGNNIALRYGILNNEIEMRQDLFYRVEGHDDYAVLGTRLRKNNLCVASESRVPIDPDRNFQPDIPRALEFIVYDYPCQTIISTAKPDHKQTSKENDVEEVMRKRIQP